MKRKTQIICTLGPASRTRSTLTKMAEAGMDMVRLNFSHGTHEEHVRMMKTIREINRTRQKKIRILQDLEGYRIRLGILSKPVDLEKGHKLWMSYKPVHTDDHVPLDADFDFSRLKKGMEIFIADGMIQLNILRVTKTRLRAEVVQGGRIDSKKGVNIPGLQLQADIMSDKDRADIQLGVEEKVDEIAMSFVRNRRDIERVNHLVRPYLPDCRIVAKVENGQGLRNLDGIMTAADVILVARGDLGVSLPIYQLPMIQKDMIRRCNRAGKPVITATQMLESMTGHPRPTRAEVTDVANAILDGTDYVMLSGETAIGAYPVRSVEMMRRIIEYTEKNIHQYRRQNSGRA